MAGKAGSSGPHSASAPLLDPPPKGLPPLAPVPGDAAHQAQLATMERSSSAPSLQPGQRQLISRGEQQARSSLTRGGGHDVSGLGQIEEVDLGDSNVDRAMGALDEVLEVGQDGPDGGRRRRKKPQKQTAYSMRLTQSPLAPQQRPQKKKR